MPMPPRRTRPHARLVATAVLMTAALLGASACDVSLGDRRDPMVAFVDAVSAHDIAAAAAMTDDPTAAADALEATFDGMGEASAHMSTTTSLRGTLTTHIAWTLPDGSKTETTGTIDDVHEGTIPWSPHIIDSRMEPGGRMLYTETLDIDSPVIGRKRDKIMTWRTATAVSIADDAPHEDVDALAVLLGRIDPTITVESIEHGMRTDAPDGQYRVATLRPEDADPIHDGLAGIATVSARPEGRLLTTDPGIDSPALDEMPQAWNDILSKSAGWKVEIDNPGDDADVRVQVKPPKDVQNVPITMDLRLQEAAQRAVGASDPATAIVALDAEDGGVLAVAQNDAADESGPVALEGLYPPGSAFKIVTATAALGAGDIHPDGTVDCPASAQFDAATITNIDGFSLDPGPLRAAFAHPCDTTQAELAQGLPDGSLPGTAHALGLGIDFDTPGLTTRTGAVPRTSPGADRALTAVGQGAVMASPFGMALAAASLARGGTTVVPMLINDEHAEVQGSADMAASGSHGSGSDGSGSDGKVAKKKVSGETAKAVRSMMRESVRSGEADTLRGVDGLLGATGAAMVAGMPAHGWFAGIDHDIAFAVFVQEADSAQPAIDVAGGFLDAVGDAIDDYS